MLISCPFSSYLYADYTDADYSFANDVLGNLNSLGPDHLSELSKHPQWHDLLHINRTGVLGPEEPQIDSAKFYLADELAWSPLNELEAFIELLRKRPLDKASLCRFPARLHWLKQQLPKINFPQVDCISFKAWFQEIDASGLSLVFPVAYLNSPSSMYGHTFLRMDRKSVENDLLDYSVSFAADASSNDDPFTYVFKGLSGGYRGIFSVLPYHAKVKEYSHLESRDLWEYRLRLTQAEVDQFVRHLWEVKDAHLDYYFFDENCAYQLLTLLDASSERFNFARHYRFNAIPVDTVRTIVEAGHVDKIQFRPSTLTQMQRMMEQSSAGELELAKALVDEKDWKLASSWLKNYSAADQARMLELAYQYSRYLVVRKKNDSKELGKRSIKILSARSKLGGESLNLAHDPFVKGHVLSGLPEPKHRDDQGHASHRVKFDYGYDGSQHFVQAGVRAAYHDHLDNALGFIKGANLEMFGLEVRRTQGANDERLRLQSVSILDIASYAARNHLIKPVAWHVALGAKRPDLAPEELLPYLNVGGGFAYEVLSQRVYLQGDAELNADNDIEKGYRLAFGPRLGLLSQNDNWSLKLEAYLPFDTIGAEFRERHFSFGLSGRLSRNWQVRVEWQARNHRDQSNKKTQTKRAYTLGIAHYF